MNYADFHFKLIRIILRASIEFHEKYFLMTFNILKKRKFILLLNFNLQIIVWFTDEKSAFLAN